MAEIVTKFSSDDKEMIAAFQAQQRELEKLKSKLKEAKEEAAAGGKVMKDSADKGAAATNAMTEKILGMATGYFSLQAAIGVVNRALQDQFNLQEKVAGVQRTSADAQIKFLRNLGIVSKQERETVLKEVAAISERAGVPQTTVYAAASEAMSAKGDLSAMAALKSVESAVRIAPESAAEASAIAGGMLDAASLTGTSDPDRNRGLLIKMQEQARNVTMSSVAQNLIPGAITLKAYGATTEQAAAATTTMTQAMKDPEGRIAVTALDRLAGLAEDVTPGGFDEDVMKLRKDPALRKRFMKKANFEKAEKFVEGFITEGHPTAKLYDQFKAGMPTAQQATKVSQDFEEGIMSPDLQQAAQFERAGQAESETNMMEDLKSGDYSRIRTRIENTAASKGIGWFQRTGAAYAGRMSGLSGESPEESGHAQLRELTTGIDRNFATEEQKKQLAALDRIANILTKIQEKKASNINAHVEPN